MVWLALALAEPPGALVGVYDVVSVSDDGSEQEEFADKMRRRALALGQDCFVSRRSYDFGQAAKARAPIVAITEQVTCRKGGLGTYQAQATLEVEATWTEGEAVAMSLPGGTVWVSMTRVQSPKSVGVPAQWAAPDFQWTLDPTSFGLSAQKTWGKKLPLIELSQEKSVYVLKPVTAGGGARPK